MTTSGEWNADAYHRVSSPQTTWGEKVLARLALAGDERAIDAGCGSGRLTASLAARLPNGHVLAIDRSANMLAVARTNLRPVFGRRVSYVRAALPLVPVQGWADVVFSTATFHWIDDHAALFAHLFAALAPGGRLHAQCGGGPNLARAHALAEDVMQRPAFAPFFTGWTGVWRFASAEDTSDRLRAAGFQDVRTDLEEAPTTLATADDYRAFVTTVIYHPHLARLPLDRHGPFIDEITALAAEGTPPFTLDYWRLNMTARRP
ncbi:MAG: methyltransferase domain-containing protein [Vicinamibacterales bacterium]